MKPLFIICCVALLFASCKPKYRCVCYSMGSADTSISMGSSLRDADRDCKAYGNTRPTDSCYVDREYYR